MSTNIVVPELGESVVEARVAKWLKKQGDSVTAGEPLVELETEKIDLEVSADRAGVLSNIKHQEGADVKVGEVLAVLEESANGAQGQVPKVPDVPMVPDVQGAKAGDKKATPTAKNVAKAHDVKIEAIESPSNRVTKQDVLKAAAPVPQSAKAPEAPKAPEARQAPEAPQAPKAPQAPRSGDRSERRERMTKRRATIARRLVEAQQTAAMLTTFNEMDMSAVQALRGRHKESFKERHGINLGMTSFFVKAVIGALRTFPRINAEIQGDEMILKHYYDIGIAAGASGQQTKSQ